VIVQKSINSTFGVAKESQRMVEAVNNPPEDQCNLQKLRRHLNDGSLAAKLVDATAAADPAHLQEALKGVISDRLADVRQNHGGSSDQ
jgi:hypothetical protein